MRQDIAQAFHLEPYQEASVDFALTHPRCGMFLKMGLGKTRVTLATIAELNPPNHILVIAPKNIARSSWIEEIETLGLNIRWNSFVVRTKLKTVTYPNGVSFEKRFISGKDLPKDKREALFDECLTAPPTIYFINRELVGSAVDYFGDHWPFAFVVIDESQSFKNPKSVRFKQMKKILKHTNRMIELTGSPMPQSIEDLWSQIYLLDGGFRLGSTISKFRDEFMLPGRCLPGRTYPYEWKPKSGAKEEIYEKIEDIVMSMDNKILNLPDITYNNLYAYMDSDEIKAYKTMLKDRVLIYGPNFEDAIEAESPGVLSGKLHQLASGCFYTDSDGHYMSFHERKLDTLEYIVNNEPSPLLVAYHFKFDIDMIKSRFPDAVIFDGSLEMRQDWNNGKIRMLLIHPASAGFGLNFQMGGHVLVWYTITNSLEQYVQTNARLHRMGQTEPVIIHHILTKNTIDKHFLDLLEQKDASQEGLMKAIEMTLDDTCLLDEEDDDFGYVPEYPV